MNVVAEPRQPSRRRAAARVALALAWVGAVAAGFVSLWAYEAAPGARGQAPERWPAESRLPRPASRGALVVAIHPRCPCSRATLEELAEVVDRCRGGLDVHVLCYRPPSADPGWAEAAPALS